MLIVTGFGDERGVLSGRGTLQELLAVVPGDTQVLIYI